MKNLLNLGKALDKAEQKQVFGGGKAYITHASNEGSGSGCSYEHHDVCANGSPCDSGDFNACGPYDGCGHWVMVC
ncbi:hypothetical protein [Winogradskyella flava]|uniref:Uncharacterized protein n=1 Tax=Winogradskyella flava TaxID=1884876 RepID=A0A842IZ40_9FLAO|nr:hypothetical protein [Winogradskyella flava]MBC2846537.1 hypothetical protein [Winogradskyella flava]